MKKILLVLILPFALFGFEIVFNKKFNKEVTPDKLSTYITITVNKNSENEITPILNNFNDFISGSRNVEKKSGDFSIRPKQKFEKGQSTIIGYSGNLKYTILANSSKDMNKFIKKLLKQKENEDTSISISMLNWIVSETKHANTTEKLQLEAINWSQKYSQELSAELNKSCQTKKINISTASYIPMYRNSRISEAVSSTISIQNVPIPEVTANDISITPNFILECK